MTVLVVTVTVAGKHDITHALLMLWVEKYQRGDLTEAVENAEQVRKYRAGICRGSARKRKTNKPGRRIVDAHHS